MPPTTCLERSGTSSHWHEELHVRPWTNTSVAVRIALAGHSGASLVLLLLLLPLLLL